MTDPIVRIEPTTAAVEPGAQTRVMITVRNLGSIVENFRLEVVDEGGANGPATWSAIAPAEVPVYPQQEAGAVLVFTPPPGRAAPSGSFPFAVRAVSTVDPSVSAVAEGLIEVGRVFGLQAKLTPVTSSGRWRGRHTVQVSNWGNTPVRLRLVGSDPDERLAFLIRPPVIDVPIGGIALARVTARTRRPFLRGTPARVPFQIVGEPDPPDPSTSGAPATYGDPRRPVLDGALTQKPVLSRMTVAVATVVVAALVGAVALSLRSSPTKQQSFETEGPPDQPVVTAASQADGTVQLSWPALRRVQSYKVFTLDGKTFRTTGTATVDGGLNQFTTAVLTPSSAYCFQLQAVRGSLSSQRSNRQCVITAAPKPSPSPSGSATESGGTGVANGPGGGTNSGGSSGPGGSGTGSSGATSPGGESTSPSGGVSTVPGQPPFLAGEYIAVVGSPHTNTLNGGKAGAIAEAGQITVESGFAADWMDVTKFPKFAILTPGAKKSTGPLWVVFLRLGLNNPAQVQQFCNLRWNSAFGPCQVAIPTGQ